MRAYFIRRYWENQAQTIISFEFKPAQAYRYEAGQYAVLSVPHEHPDARGTDRTMTLSSSPDASHLKFTMRLSNEHGSSFKRALYQLQANDEVTIFDAMGDLVLPLDTTIPLLFIAGGIGIASYVGMIDWLTAHRDRRTITLLSSVPRATDLVFQPQFQAYSRLKRFHQVIYTPDVSMQPTGAYQIKHQRLSAAGAASYITPDTFVYLSGPEAMVSDVYAQLIDQGVSDQHIVFDYFSGYEADTEFELV